VILVLRESCLQKLKKKLLLRIIENNNTKKFWLAIRKNELQENKSLKKALGRYYMKPKSKGQRRSVTCQLLFKQDGIDPLKLFFWTRIIIKVSICGAWVAFWLNLYIPLLSTLKKKDSIREIDSFLKVILAILSHLLKRKRSFQSMIS